MGIYKNKMLYVLHEDGTGYEPFMTVGNEIFLTADLVSEEIFGGDGYGYENAVLSPTSRRVIRVYILNKDETPYRDISEYISDWSINFNYAQGSTRSGNITVMNYNNEWSPSPVKGTFWKGTKIRMHVGISHGGIIYWRDCGILVCGNISIDAEKGTISIPLYDKYAMMDGTIGGKSNYAFRINVGSGVTVKGAIETCLTTKTIDDENGNFSDWANVYDTKPMFFPSGKIAVTSTTDLQEYSEVTLPYSLQKDPNGNIGEIITELAQMLSLDIYYNNEGNLTLSPGAVTNDDLENRSVLWVYEDNHRQYTQPSLDIDFSNLVNSIIVKGAIENGKQYSGTVVNKSPKSQANIYFTEPNPLYIEDSNIIGDTLCQTRAEYEMIKQGRLSVQLKFKSIFIPHLECNNLIFINNSKLGFVNEKFVINSIEMSSDMLMSISASSVSEVIF